MLEGPKVSRQYAFIPFQNKFSMAERSPRQVKIPLHLLRLPISAGKGASNLTRLQNAIPTTTRKRNE